MPADRLESRRAIKQVLATVEAIAFLHQGQREQDADGYLIATPDDYQLARRLLIGPLNEAVGIGDRLFRTLGLLQRKYPKRVFTSTETIEAGIFNNKMTRDRVLKDLVELDAVRCVEESKGKNPARWQLTDKQPKPVLPANVA
jgi:hypothetical protein